MKGKREEKGEGSPREGERAEKEGGRNGLSHLRSPSCPSSIHLNFLAFAFDFVYGHAYCRVGR